DIAVKWRRIADPDQPVLWLDQMPARSLSRGFNNHINLIRGQVINMRYLEYFEKILHFIKDRILVYHGANNPKGLLEVREALEKVHKVEDLLPIMKVTLASEWQSMFLEEKKTNSTFLKRTQNY
ncbi:tetratricopeptide repeat domain 13, partial [Homo sapiens]